MRNVHVLVLALASAVSGAACGGRYDAHEASGDAGGASADASAALGDAGLGDAGGDAQGGEEQSEPPIAEGGPANPLQCPAGFTLGGGGCGRWQPAGQNAGAAIDCRTATTLLDGRVLLVACGTAGAMLYDPAADTFSALAPALAPVDPLLTGFTATRLQDGRVLVVGGSDGEGYPVTANAELFDPATQAFRPTGAMSTPRFQHASALLPDGRVLTTGGASTNPGAGGIVDVVPLASAEIFDPASETWSPAASPSTPRMEHVAVTSADGSVIVVGGVSAWNQWLGATEVYGAYQEPSGATTVGWQPAPAIGNMSVEGLAAALLSGGAVLGASYGGGDVLDVLRSTWTPTQGSSLGPNGGLVALPHGRALSISTDPYASHSNAASVFDSATNTWSPTASPAAWHYDHVAAALLDGRVFALGGEAGYAAEIFTWVEATP